jgi:hypothetical protein
MGFETAYQKLTLATASGPIWLALAAHVSAGIIAVLTGFTAIVARKGGAWHAKAGIIFTVAMIAMGLLGALVAAYERNAGSVAGGLFATYFVATGAITVRPAWQHRWLNVGLMLAAFVYAATSYRSGITLLVAGRMFTNGVPVPMILFLGTIALLAAIGDYRFVRDRGIQGPRRIARHLWRMCFGFFVATGSFFIGQMKVIPAPVRNVPLLFALGLAPLAALLYWMWRVRLRRQLRGLVISRA